MKKSDFYYDLPKELIAQTPVYPRDSSRLYFYNMDTGEQKDLIFRDIADILKKGDVLVVNNTRVINARLHGYDDKGRIYEIFILKRTELKKCEILLKPARKAKIGTVLTVNEELAFKIEDILDDGVRKAEIIFDGVFEDILSRVGEVPLPPYITEKLDNAERYQTVYSKISGSGAAPTAGLHFTDELMQKLRDNGVIVVEVLLHVGLGTFRPVKEDDILDHKMHSEYYEIGEESAVIINDAVKSGRKIIAVGTTSVRVLESAANDDGTVRPFKGETDIFIYPGYKFKTVDCLITNFHLPESTLIMLISAMVGREKVLELYRDAVEKKYRFFSFGDAMFLYGKGKSTGESKSDV